MEIDDVAEYIVPDPMEKFPASHLGLGIDIFLVTMIPACSYLWILIF